MSATDEPGIHIHIDFSPPASRELRVAQPLHTREVKHIPGPVARQMIRDFADYRDDPSESKRCRLYSYRPSDSPESEVQLPLDFSEVRAIRMR